MKFSGRAVTASRLRYAALGMVSLFSLAAAMPAASANPQDQSRRAIDVSAKRLDLALNELARQTGMQIVLRSDDADGIITVPLTGEFTVEEALETLLQPTGLTYKFINAYTVAVVPQRRSQARPTQRYTATTPAYAPIQVSAQQTILSDSADEAEDEERVIDTITVQGTVPTRNRTESVAPELVYDQEFFQKFEPLSVGDALKRVPGVTFSTDVGEFDDPGLRGLTNGFTQVLINGKPITSAGGGDATTRTVFVDRIPAELIEKIEIIRSPGADIDSQGVAGTINIVLKQGANLPEGGYLRATGIQYVRNVEGNDGTFRGTGALGYAGRALDDKLTYSINGNIQQRFNSKFAVQEVFDPDNFADVDAASDALVFGESGSVVGDGEERTIQNDERENLDYAINGDINYTTDAGHTFGFSGFYIRTERDEREDELVFEDAADNLVEIAAQDTEFEQDNFGVEGTAAFVLSPTVSTDFRVAFNRFDNTIEETDLELDAEDIEGTLPTEVTFRDSFTVEPFNPEPDELEVFDTEDREVQIDGALSWNLDTLAQSWGLRGLTFKTGVQIKLRDRDSSLLNFGFDDGVLEIDDPEPTDLGGVFSLQENRYDTFAVLDWNLTDRLSLETGIRFEVTDTDQDGFAYGEAIDANSDDFDANPSAHIRYRFNDFITGRFSYARTVRRPDFNERIPFLLDDQPDDLDTVAGNPDLDFETSNGLDAGLEFNLPGGGVAGINGFYRDVSNIIQLVNLGPNGATEDDDGDLIIGDDFTFANVGDAIAYGFEVDLSTSLGFIGLPNTGLFANYTLLRSEVDNAFVDLENTPINEQPRFVYNVGATHNFEKLGLTLGISFQDQGTETSTFFDEIQTTGFSPNLEAFVEQKVTDRILLRVSGSNLLDASTFQTEENFEGPITAGDLDNFEIEREEAQPRIQFTLRAVF